jgi:hypothetical protein
MSITLPDTIVKTTVFGYVFDDDGVTPIENAKVHFKSAPFMKDDNLLEIDTEVVTDSEGRYQADLPTTVSASQAFATVTVDIRWTDAQGNSKDKQEMILVPETGPVSVQVARTEAADAGQIYSGPQGPAGPQGPIGPQGLPGGALSSFDISGGGTQNALTPGFYFVDSSAGPTTLRIPDASGATEDSSYRIYKIDSSANDVTVVTVGGTQLIGGSTSQIISVPNKGFSLLDQTTNYKIVQDSRPSFNGSTQSVGTANSDGVVNSSARSDHVHDHGAQTEPTHHADAIPGGNAGFMTGADKSKLDGIESGATADQTGAEIKALYEAEADTNAFTDAEQTKLAGIEAGAEVNQTDAEIKTQYENNPDTNAFTDAEQTKLAGIEAGATVETGSLVAPPAIAVAGAAGTDTGVYANDDHTHAHGAQTDETLHALATPGANGFMSAADKTKLNGIETGATADAASGVAPPDVAAAGSAGTDTNTYANSNHTHGHGNQAGGSLHAVAVAGVAAGFMSAADKTKLDGLGAGTATQDFFFPMGNLITNYSEYAVATVGASGTGYCSFKVPADFTTLTSLELVGIIDPAAAGGGKNIDFFSSYGAIGEDRNNHAESDTSGATNLTGTDNELYSFDISSVFTLLAAGDYAGLRVLHNSIGGNIYYLGIRLKYT